MSKQQILGLAKVLGGYVVIWVLIWFYGANGCAKVPGNQMAPTVTPAGGSL